jgi:transcriptional regulator with XRE-family HTH domain
MELRKLFDPRVARRRAAIGRKLEQARKSRGLTLSATAERLDVTRQAYTRWERGRASIPAELVPDVAEVVGTSVSEVFGTDDGDDAITLDPAA